MPNLTDLMLTTGKRRVFCSDYNNNCGGDCVGCERYEQELAAIAKAVVELKAQGWLYCRSCPASECYPKCGLRALLKQAREVLEGK